MMAARLLTKAKIEILISKLIGLYPGARCELDFRSVFELLIAVVLSAQTTDVSVNKVTPELFRRWPDAASLASAPQEDVEKVIRPIGMYRQKSKNITRLSAILTEGYQGEVPGSFDELVRLPGVGRKTANVVLAEAFGEDRIAVDTHVFRLANRMGLCREDTPEKTEEALMDRIPAGRRSETHHALIWHGRRVCHARKPGCADCGVSDVCLKIGLAPTNRQAP
ncbi:MAG: endonuclease III [Clostridiales Family XIII bacterium]|jgi:endonuclease-3|nr:endonuclease III [Clostridiales Family XIII bacterium]